MYTPGKMMSTASREVQYKGIGLERQFKDGDQVIVPV